jgi:hypothetical protein
LNFLFQSQQKLLILTNHPAPDKQTVNSKSMNPPAPDKKPVDESASAPAITFQMLMLQISNYCFSKF